MPGEDTMTLRGTLEQVFLGYPDKSFLVKDIVRLMSDHGYDDRDVRGVLEELAMEGIIRTSIAVGDMGSYQLLYTSRRV